MSELNPILGKLGVTHDFSWRLVGKPVVKFLFALIELFRYLLRFRSYEAKCVQLGCFHRGVDVFVLKFYLHRVIPIKYTWRLKTRDTGCPKVKTASLCVPSFWHNNGVWRTDIRTDRFAVAYTALAKLALRRVVKVLIRRQEVPLLASVSDRCLETFFWSAIQLPLSDANAPTIKDFTKSWVVIMIVVIIAVRAATTSALRLALTQQPTCESRFEKL